MPNYSKNAFTCHKCPKTNGDGGCPAWWESIWENPETKESKVLKGCAFEQMQTYLLEVIRASNRPAAAIESARNEIASGFGRVASVMKALPDVRKN